MAYISDTIKLQYPNKRLYITSRLRDGGTDSNYTINFTNAPVEIPPNKRAYMGLMKASITNSFYPINATNNRLDFSIDATNTSTTIEPGYYSAAAMATAIQTPIQTLIGTTASDPLFSVSFNSGIGKFTISLDANGTAQNLTVRLKASSPIGYYIGLTEDAIVALTNVDPNEKNSVTFTALPHLSGPIVYQVRTNVVAPNVWTKGESSYSSILAVIPIAGGPFDTTIYDPINVELNEFFSQISSMNIIITDENANQIDFNGQANDMLIGIYLTDM